MVARARSFFQQGVNMYVPGMSYASDMQIGQPTVFSLGTPAAASASAITTLVNAQSVALTVLLLSSVYTVDSPYGRTLVVTPSGNPGNSAAIDVIGTDYLGQPVVERFTGASGATSALYGNKAFYRVISTRSAVAASNAVTWSVGTGTRLGLPYKGDIEWCKEAGLPVILNKRDYIVDFARSAADAVAGGSFFVRSRGPGFVKNLVGQPTGGGSTNNPVVTAKLATVLITGLTITIIDNDTTGALVTAAPTTAGYSANNRLVNNSPIELVTTSAASAKGDLIGVTITPTQFTPGVLTDPQTLTAGDPRGTYEALLTYDGASKIEVGLMPDNSVNASNNGGLHGIRHVVA